MDWFICILNQVPSPEVNNQDQPLWNLDFREGQKNPPTSVWKDNLTKKNSINQIGVFWEPCQVKVLRSYINYFYERLFPGIFVFALVNKNEYGNVEWIFQRYI